MKGYYLSEEFYMRILKLNMLKFGLVPCLTLGLVILIILHPQRSFESALNGLGIWLDIVLPALLPFFIVSEIMIGLGLVDFISVLLNPVMEPLFKCPGSSSFIWVMSITSGYPMGAKLVSSFYQAGKISKDESQRILSFCSTSGPLFMIGAVGIGMLGSSEAGRLIAFSHYTSAIILGLIFRFYNSSKQEASLRSSKKNHNISSQRLLSRAFQEMSNARKKEKRSFGELIGDAVRNSMNSLFLIGGFIILFSVILNLLLEIGLIQGIAKVLQTLMPFSSYISSLIHGFCAGMLEVTMGCKTVSDTTVPLYYKIITISFLIGWSGFSIHSQTAGLLGKTSVSLPIYLITKLAHGIISGFISWIVMTFYYNGDISTFYTSPSILTPSTVFSRLNIFSNSIKLLIISFVALILLISSAIFLMKIKSHLSKKNRSKKPDRLSF